MLRVSGKTHNIRIYFRWLFIKPLEFIRRNPEICLL